MYGNRLKDCREDLDLTQNGLGFMFGVSDGVVRSWENGHYTIPLPKLCKFCSKFNYSIDYVMGVIKRNIKYGSFNIDKLVTSSRLKSVRSSLKLSQIELSNKCKSAQTTYSGYECGKYLINTTNLYSLCKTFDISMDYLMGRKDSPKIVEKEEKVINQ